MLKKNLFIILNSFFIGLFLVIFIEMNFRLDGNFFLIKKNYLYVSILIVLISSIFVKKARFISINIFILYSLLFPLNFFLKSDLYRTAGYKSNYEIAKEKNLFFDNRSTLQFYKDLKKENDISSLYSVIDNLSVNSSISNLNLSIFPISTGVPNSNSIYCNESGEYDFLKLDKYGFPNDNQIYEKKNLIFDFILLGDSFTKGCGVTNKNKPSYILEKKYDYKILNLANGGGLLSYYAAYKEYGKYFKSRYVVLNFYEGNDFTDFIYETKTYLKNYLDDDFDQNLINKTSEVEKIYKKIFNHSFDAINEKKSKQKTYFIKLISLDNLLNTYNSHFDRFKLNQRYKSDILNKEQFSLILLRIKKIIEKNNSELIINILPTWERYYLNHQDNDQYLFNLKFKELLKKLEIEFIELNSYIKLKHKNPIELYRFKRHNHFNELGYSIMADQIHDKFKGR